MTKTIMGYTAEEIRGQAIAFKCGTEELAEDLVKKLYDIGVKWPNAKGSEVTMWGDYQEDTCYGIYDNKKFQQGDFFRYDEPNEWEKRGYKIIDYSIGTEQRVYKAWELEEGVDYECLDSYFEGTVIWREFGELWFERDRNETILTPESTELTLFEILEFEFIEAEWSPKEGDTCYFPTFLNLEGYSSWPWHDQDLDCKIKRTVGVYRTEEEAIEKAKELGWH